MSLADALLREDRIEVKASTLYEMMKGCVRSELMINGLMHKVSGEDILRVMLPNLDGFQAQEQEKKGADADAEV